MNELKIRLATVMHTAAARLDPRPTRQELWKQGKWVTADGDVIPVTLISNTHLVNIARFLWRWAEDKSTREGLAYCMLPMPNGEMAQLAYMDEIDYLAEHGTEQHFEAHPFYPHLAAELDRRNLWSCLDEKPA